MIYWDRLNNIQYEIYTNVSYWQFGVLKSKWND